MESIAFFGPCLHSGASGSVRLNRRTGPVCLVQAGQSAAIAELSVERADRGVLVARAGGAPRVDLVEHLFAALGALGIGAGLEIEVDGGELPLLDGGAAEWGAALGALGLARARRTLTVVREGVIDHGGSRYAFRPATAPRIDVEVEFPGVGTQRARWDGNAVKFLSEIAPARTFGYRRDLDELRAQGRARHVDTRAVLVLDDEGNAIPPSAAMQPDELARHKLLDLIGDLYLHGGPPLGEIRARRPGHAATHAVVEKAIAHGLMERR